jgi:hypothetical protein
MAKTISKFIADNRLRMECDWADENPHMSDMPRGSTHWRCKLKCGRRSMTVYFSQGPAHTKEPDIESVVDCLASDVGGLLNAQSFEDWASEYGYDTDSRKAEQTFKTIMKQGDDLARLLGDTSIVRELAFETERL